MSARVLVGLLPGSRRRVDAGERVVVCASCGLSGPMGHVSPDAQALAQLHDRIHHGDAVTASVPLAAVAGSSYALAAGGGS